MPRKELKDVMEIAEKTKTGAYQGKVLDPIPVDQAQEGPTCGYYALSIVLNYWKAKGKSSVSLPARDRDVRPSVGGSKADKDQRPPSLRKLGRTHAGVLDTTGVVKRSTGGVWSAHQLAQVAVAVNGGYNVSVKTKNDAPSFIDSICDAIKDDTPPIVAFDVLEGDPNPKGVGEHSHWGVIIGYYHVDKALWYVATHGHGGYYLWLATSLQQSNFALVGKTFRGSAETKVKFSEEFKVASHLKKYERTQWVSPERLKELENEALFEEDLVKLAVREEFEVRLDLGGHIVLVKPAG
jgi:hypothetical protein